MIGVGLSIVQLAVRQLLGRTFNPLDLFANGEQGAWYDVNLTDGVLFQDSAGTTPVTAVEQPVGLMLDKSKGLVLGPQLVTNGDFSSGTTGWTGNANTSLSVVNGRLRATAINNGAIQVSRSSVPFTPGMYRASGEVYKNTSALVYSLYPGWNAIQNTPFYRVIQATTTASIGFVTDSTPLAGDYFEIDNISVRELPGNHAFQSTSASRPVLSALVNLLTKTEQFDDAVWSKRNVTLVSGQTPPTGVNTAFLMYPATSGADRDFFQTTTISSGASYIGSFLVKPAGWRWVSLDGTNTSRAAYFDLQNGVLGTTAAGHAASIENAGNGWWRISVTTTAASSSLGYTTLKLVDGDASNYATASGTNGILVTGSDLRVANDGVGLPAYQRVNTATDYDTTGFPLYLRADGVDDGMVTNSINFTATDKMTVWAGVRKLSDAAAGAFVELSPNINTNTSVFGIFAPANSATGDYSFRSKGTADSGSSGTSAAMYPQPITNVLTGIGNISGDSAILRINGTQAASSTVDQGSGNFGNYPLYLFRRGGTTLPFNGRFYSLIVRGAASTTAQIEATEAYVNSRTKAFA